MQHRSEPLESVMLESGNEPVTVSIRGFRHDNGEDWPDTVLTMGDLGYHLLEMEVPSARRYASAVIRACDIIEDAQTPKSCGPLQRDVDAVRDLLDIMENFADNDQRACYLLCSTWLSQRGALASERLNAQTETV